MAMRHTPLQDFTDLAARLRPLSEARVWMEYDAYGAYTERREAYTEPGQHALAALDASELYDWGTLPAESVGWRSIVGRPYHPRGLAPAYLVGGEAVFGHAHRGACPAFDLHLVPRRSHEALARALTGAGFDPAHHRPRYGYVVSDALTPEEHLAAESDVLAMAAAALARGTLALMRTAALSPAQLAKHGKFVIGVARGLARQYSAEDTALIQRQRL